MYIYMYIYIYICICSGFIYLAIYIFMYSDLQRETAVAISKTNSTHLYRLNRPKKGEMGMFEESN